MMSTRIYRFCGTDFKITMPEGIMFEDEHRLAPFFEGFSEDEHGFSFEKVEELSKPEGEHAANLPNCVVYTDGTKEIRYIGADEHGIENAYMRAEHDGKKHEVQLLAGKFPGKIGTHNVLEAIAAEHIAVLNGGVILHCSFIERNGKAVLFTAPSGTGKSTQAELWKKFRGADIINGDRAFLHFAEEKFFAEGIPFSGSSKYCKNKVLPLEAIVYLGQAKETSVTRLHGYEAFSKIWEGISLNTWNRSDVEKALDIVKGAAEKTAVFYMPCTPDENAVIALEKALEGESNEQK